MSTACKVSLALLCLFAVASFLVLTAVAGNKTKQTSSNMVSQLTFCAGPCLTGTNDSEKTSRTELCILRNPITAKEYFSVSIYLVSVDVKECSDNGSHLSKIVKIVIRLQSSKINV